MAHSKGQRHGTGVWAMKAVQLREGASNHQSDVILLFAAAAELLDGADNVLKEGLHRKSRIAFKCLDQMGLTELFSVRVRRFGHSIGVEDERITWSKFPLPQSRTATLQIIP